MACDSLSMTHGPAMRTSGSRPRTTPSAIVTWRTRARDCTLASPIADGGHIRGHALGRHLALVSSLDESSEQRMRAQRLRFEFRVELNSQIPGMPWQLDDLHELPVERAADDTQPAFDERLLIEAIELVPVAVALVDDFLAVEPEGQRIGRQLA